MKISNIRITIIIQLCLFFSCGTITGQTSDSIKNNHIIKQIGLDIAPNYVFQTKGFLKGNNEKESRIDKSMSLHIKYGFKFANDTYLGRLYPHAYQGIGLSFNTFFNSEEVGNPIAFYLFQGSRIATLSPKVSLDYEWNFGASFGWKPYNINTNKYNDIVGSRINAYLNIGIFLNWQLKKQWNISAGIDATHYSNGNTKYPNYGINLIGARVGVTKVLDAEKETKINNSEKLSVEKHISYDIIVYGAWHAKGIIGENAAIPGYFGVLGLNFNPMYNINKYFKAGISLDGQYDEGANTESHIAGLDENGEIKFYRPSLSEQIGVGLSMRGEFVMPIFSINFGIGHNVVYKGSLNGLYQILALKTNINRNLYLHIGYQLSKFKNPKNLMIGFGYRLHNKRR